LDFALKSLQHPLPPTIIVRAAKEKPIKLTNTRRKYNI
jgi:hypothetical protein